MIAAVGIIPVPLYFLGRNENVFPVLPALRIDLAVDRFDFGRVAVRIVATAERRIIRHVPRRIKPLMQRPILSGMVAISGLVLLTFLRMDERCQQASVREEELAKKVQGAVSLLMGALYEGKIVSNSVKRRHLNSSQRAMAVAMMYPEARHGGSRQAGSSSATELDISKDRLSMARTVLRALPSAMSRCRDVVLPGGELQDLCLEGPRPPRFAPATS